VEDTLDLGWKLFSMLPEEDLKLINEKWIKKVSSKYREKTK